MQTNLYSLDALTESLPKEIKELYTITGFISASRHNIILLLNSVDIKEKEKFVLKILDNEYYDKTLYQKIAGLSDSSLLLPIQTFSDAACQYFVYLYLDTLAKSISEKHIDYSMIRSFVSSIGNAVITLHQHKILHLDITPDNIFIDTKGHFYLGDFSSARFAKNSGLFSFLSHRSLSTGTTSAFAPSEEMQQNPISYWNDCHNFACLLYLLCNGVFPDENKLADSSPFHSLNPFLIKWTRAPATNHCNIMKEFLDDLEDILTLCDTDSNCQNYSLQLSDSAKNRLSEKTSPCPLDISPSHRFSTPAPVYGLLALCCLLFLFSLHNYLSNNKYEKRNENLILSEQPDNTPSQSTVHKIKTTDNPTSFLVSNTPNINIPPSNIPHDTPTVSTPPPTETDEKKILNISHSAYYDYTFLQKVSNKNIKILFANNCKFTSCTAFSTLTCLEELYLNGNALTSVNGLNNLPKLKILVLSANKLTDISSLAGISSLTVLDLSHNHHLKKLRSLSSLKKLHCLVLTNTNAVKKDILFLQKKLPQCTIFY